MISAEQLSVLARHAGGAPIAAYDVGARGGVEPHWREFLGWMQVIALEPDPQSCSAGAASAEANVHWYPHALGRRTGKQALYVLNRASGSSFYPPNEEIFAEVNAPNYYGLNRIEQVETFSFSDFIRTRDTLPPNLVKLDTQGSELDIIQSLDEQHAQNLLCIQTEVEFEEMYKGQPLFAEIDAHIRSRGFRLFDLRTHRAYLSNNQQPAYYLRHHLNFASGRNDLSAKLVAGDALYFRDFRREFPDNREIWAKLVVILLIYRYYDYAIDSIQRGASSGLISESEAATAIDQLRSIAPVPKVHERSRGRAAVLCRRLLKQLNLGQSRYQAFWALRHWPDQ